MALSYVNYPADGATTQFALTFGYLRRSHVFVFVDNNLAAFKWVSGTNIEITPAPADGAEVRIQRLTDKVNRITDFSDGQTLLAGDLDAATLQNFYLSQEMLDGIVDGVLQGDVILNQPLAATGDPLTLQQVQTYLDEAARNSPVIEALLADVSVNAADIAAEISDRTAAIAAEATARAQGLADEAAARLGDVLGLQGQLDTTVTNTAANAAAIAQEVTDRSNAVQGQADDLQDEIDARIAGDAAEASARSAAILAEAATRTSELLEEAQARGELARKLDTVYAEMATGLAAVVSEIQASADENEAFAQKTDLIAARVDDAEASILSEQTARIGAINDEITAREAAIAAEAGLRAGDVAALTTDINLVRTDYGNADSAILSQLNSLSSDHVALAQTVDNLEATFIDGDFTAAINSEATARADADSALAEQLDLLTAESGENFALAFSLVSALTAKDESTVRSVESLQSSFDGNIARIDSELATITTDTSANATSITSISASLGATQSDVSQAQSDITQAQADIVLVNQAVVDEASARASDVSTLQGQIDGNSASITSTSDAISTRVDALAREQTLVSAEIAGALASLVAENEARADEDEALSTSIFALNAEVADNLALIISEQTARADGDSANATAISALDVRVGATETGVSDNAAAITAEQTARANADTAIASDVTALTARVGTAESDISANASAIVTEQSARATADTAIANDVTALTARVETAEGDITTNAASILTESSVRADALAAISRDLTALRAEYASSLAWSVSELETRADENEAVVTSISAIQAEVADNTAAIVSEQTARADGDSANATAISALDVRVGATETGVSDNAAAIASESTARADADSALTTQFNGLSTSVGTAQTDIASLQEGQSTLEAATTRSLDAQIAQLAGALAGAFTEIETRADENEVTATRIDQLSVNLQDNYATITTVAEVSVAASDAQSTADDAATAASNAQSTANSAATAASNAQGTADGAALAATNAQGTADGAATAASNAQGTADSAASAASGAQGTADDALTRVTAMYGVRLDVNGYVSGFGLSNDGATSEFAILADSFKVARPGQGGPVGLFSIDGSGNVVMQNAIIAGALIQELTADKITAGTINVDIVVDGLLEVGTGQITFDNGVYMKVQGVAFGANNDLIEWYGPKMAITAMTKANAIYYTDTSGNLKITGSATIDQAAIDNLQVERVHLASGALGAFAFDETAPSSHSFHTNTSVLNTTGFTKLDLVTDWVDIEVGDRVEAELFYSMQGGFNAYEWLYFQDSLTFEVERANTSTGTYYPTGYNKKRRAGFASNTGGGDGNTPSGTTIPWDFTNKHAVRVPASGGAWWNGASGPVRVRAKVTIQAFAPHGSNCALGGVASSYRSDTEITGPQLEVRVFALS